MATPFDDAAAIVERLPRSKRGGQPVFGSLVLHRLIQRGGMAAVFEASPRDDRKRRVALKCLLPELASDPEQFARFQQEAHLLKRLDHPNIVRALSNARTLDDVAGGAPIHYFFMELVSGPNLGDRLVQMAPLAIPEVRRLAVSILEGLAHIHEQGLVHRDLTLSNVLVGDGDEVKLIDLGLAKNLVAPDEGRTGLWGAMGKSGFIPPERPSDATPAYDLYTYGATLYYLLVGKGPTGFSRSVSPPWLRPTPFDDLAQQRPEAGPLIALVARCTARDPNDRYQDARAALAALVGQDRVDSTNEHESAEERTQPFRRPSTASARIVDSVRPALPVSPSSTEAAESFAAAMSSLSEAHRRLGDDREAQRVLKRLEALLDYESA